jgi:hypothetical protein
VKKSLLYLLLVGLLLGLAPLATTSPALAKDTPAVGGADSGLKPVAVVSIASYERIISDIAFIGKISQQPGLEKQAEGMLMILAQGLAGLDKTRPWGVVVSTDGTNFPRVGFLPVSSAKELLASLQAAVGPAEDAGDGNYVLEKNNLKIYVKEQNGWAFISDSNDTLAGLPKDPIKWLDGLDKKYEIGVQFRISNVPEMFRSLAIDQMKEGIEAGLKQQPGEDDATFELRRKLVLSRTKVLDDIINDADQVTIGWGIDQQAKSTSLDISMTAKPNSELAKKVAASVPVPSSYNGFNVAKSAFTLGFSQTVTKDDIAQLGATLDSLKVTALQEIDKSHDLPDDGAKTAAKGIVVDLIEALRSIGADGKSDGGFSLLLGSKTLTGLGGLSLGNPMKVESALKKLSDQAAKDPNIPKIKFDAEKYGDVRFHTAKLPVPPNEDVAKVVGSTLDVAVGIGPKNVYFGFGTDVLGTIKKAIDKSKTDTSKPIAPGFAIVSAQPILEFANVMEPNPLNQALAAELAKSPGKDHIQLLASPITNGVSYHLEIQEAVLNLVGVGVKMNSGAGGGRQNGFGPPGGAPGPGGRPAPPQRVR